MKWEDMVRLDIAGRSVQGIQCENGFGMILYCFAGHSHVEKCQSTLPCLLVAAGLHRYSRLVDEVQEVPFSVLYKH